MLVIEMPSSLNYMMLAESDKGGRMIDVIKIILPIFISSSDYDKMRQKLASFVFYEIFIATWLLRQTKAVGEFFKHYEDRILVQNLSSAPGWIYDINVSGFVIALVLALITYIFHFHDRLSDLFGIRKRFDTNHIVKALAEDIGLEFTDEMKKAVEAQHDRVMRNVFYTYTSSRAETPLVDKHDIIQALDAWTWFWVCLEGVAVWAMAASVACLIGSPMLTQGFLVLLAGYLIVMLLIHPMLKRRAAAQVEKIADDHTAQLKVKEYLGALSR